MPENPLCGGWQQEIVAIRHRRGHPRYLITVVREPCPKCATGTRTRSTWATLTGVGEEVAWCAHCFNATCRPADLGPEDHERLLDLRASVGARPNPRLWEAVRPALEDLERRGLL